MQRLSGFHATLRRFARHAVGVRCLRGGNSLVWASSPILAQPKQPLTTTLGGLCARFGSININILSRNRTSTSGPYVYATFSPCGQSVRLLLGTMHRHAISLPQFQLRGEAGVQPEGGALGGLLFVPAAAGKGENGQSCASVEPGGRAVSGAADEHHPGAIVAGASRRAENADGE